jgi:hypothetical protein
VSPGPEVRLEPITREIHALALESLYTSLAGVQQAEVFLGSHWSPGNAHIIPELARRAAGLRVAIGYHKACYDLCPSCDDHAPLPGIATRS